jgi:hypothetical protein
MATRPAPSAGATDTAKAAALPTSTGSTRVTVTVYGPAA